MKIYGVGDIHRNLHFLKFNLNLKRDCHIFHVGDLEVGFLPEEKQVKILEDLNEYLKEKNIFLYSIRGNHDDPYYFQGNHIYTHLQLLPDYTIIEVEDKKVLCVGGATSIDRLGAKWQAEINENVGQPRLYWEDEPFVLREDLLEKVKGINMVVTHTAPTYCSPEFNGFFPKFLKDIFKDDKTLKDDLRAEREKLDQMFKILNKRNTIKHHIYGHFHRYDITNNYHTLHIALDKNEFYEIG